MRKKLFLTSLAVLFLFGASYDVRAQSRKPSQVLRELTEERKRAMKDFESEDPGDPYAFLDERAKVEEAIREKAAQAASGFKITEWKGEDLIALSTLYSLAEMKPQAVEALRAALASEPKGRNAPMLELRLIRTLLDLDQLQEAKNRIESLQSPAALRSAGPLPGILLYRDLASALAARGEHENAAHQAEKGYLLSEAVLASGNAPEEIEVRIRTEQLKLAAAAIASFEKAAKKQDAERLARLVEKFDIKLNPELRNSYQSELARARLIGSPAPELIASRWLESEGIKLSELRGKVLLLDFWAMWCTPSILSYPSSAKELQAKYAGRGFQAIAVTRFYGRSDTTESLTRDQELQDLKKCKTKFNLPWPVAIAKMDDLTNDEQYGVNMAPAIVLIDRRGRIRYIKREPGDPWKFTREIEKLLDEDAT
jgi:thiol-disulfide isomerase/thioredoxin